MTTKRIWAGPTFTAVNTAMNIAVNTAMNIATNAAMNLVASAHLDHGKSAAGAP